MRTRGWCSTNPETHSQKHGRGHGVGDRGSLGVGEPNNELWLLVTIMTVADAAVAAAVPWQEASPAPFTRHDRAIPHQL